MPLNKLAAKNAVAFLPMSLPTLGSTPAPRQP